MKVIERSSRLSKAKELRLFNPTTAPNIRIKTSIDVQSTESREGSRRRTTQSKTGHRKGESSPSWKRQDSVFCCRPGCQNCSGLRPSTLQTTFTIDVKFLDRRATSSSPKKGGTLDEEHEPLRFQSEPLRNDAQKEDGVNLNESYAEDFHGFARVDEKGEDFQDANDSFGKDFHGFDTRGQSRGQNEPSTLISKSSEPLIASNAKVSTSRKFLSENETENTELAFLSEIPTDTALSSPEYGDWMKAMAKEMDSIIQNETWSFIPRSQASCKVIGSRFVL